MSSEQPPRLAEGTGGPPVRSPAAGQAPDPPRRRRPAPRGRRPTLYVLQVETRYYVYLLAARRALISAQNYTTMQTAWAACSELAIDLGLEARREAPPTYTPPPQNRRRRAEPHHS